MDAATFGRLSAIAATCVVLYVLGRASGGKVVELVLPQNFVGEIRIVLDAKGEPASSTGGRTTFRVPESGVVRVQSVSSFTEWHSLVATFDNGRILPQAISRSDTRAVCGSPQSYLWSGSFVQVDDRSEVRFFVGTAEEYDEWARRNY